MRLFWNNKDGGPKSHVYVYGLEIKSLFSVLVIRFEPGTRNAYHTHAFNSLSWLLKGILIEDHRSSDVHCVPNRETYRRSIRPILTLRDTFHKVFSVGRSYAFSLRGPWARTWKEYAPREFNNGWRETTLTHGRKVVG